MQEESGYARREVLEIKETAEGLFDLLLPICDASILLKVLAPDVPWVTIVEFWSNDICRWLEQNMPPLFGQTHRIETVQIKRLDMDVCLPTIDFLGFLPHLSGQGIEVVQSLRPLPSSLSINDLSPGAKARVFRDIGITLQFFLPHPHENALVTSPLMEVVHRIASSLRS